MPHGDRYSGPVGSRRRERDARRPARTASDINLRSFVTLSLRARLSITAPNAESYYSVRRKKNHKKRFFGTPYGFFFEKTFFPNSCYFPRQYDPVRSQKAADLKKMRAQALRARDTTFYCGTGLEWLRDSDHETEGFAADGSGLRWCSGTCECQTPQEALLVRSA